MGGQNEMKGKTFCSGGLEKEQGELFMTKLLIKKEAFRSTTLIFYFVLKRYIIIFQGKNPLKYKKLNFKICIFSKTSIWDSP